LNKNPNTSKTQEHSVVQSNGLVRGYAFGANNKIVLLKKGGAEIAISGKIDLKKYLFSFK